jgi:hypothetical protein
VRVKELFAGAELLLRPCCRSAVHNAEAHHHQNEHTDKCWKVDMVTLSFIH